MANDTEIKEILGNLLVKAGLDLSSEPYDTHYIRDIQGELRKLASRTIDERLTFLVFFIPLFVDDIYYNLVGDIVGINSEILEGVRKEMFAYLGKSLIELSGILETGEMDHLFPVYAKLVAFYISKVNELNALSPR